jgi:aryl-alcohol dehydrogenase-like predicted oxidoreductase
MMDAMPQRQLGAGGPLVSALGLGCMALSGAYGHADAEESIATIHAALEAGVTLLDTADFYGMGHNEMLVREVLWATQRDRVFLSLKFGAQWGPDRTFLGIDARPSSVKNFLTYSLRRLGTDYVDLYQPARVDPAVPIEETVGAIADLVKQGYVRHIGLSEASADSVRRAHAEHPISALQIEYSLLSRGIEAGIRPTLRELGIALVAYGVLSRGLIGGRGVAEGRVPDDSRRLYPRFQHENLSRNLALLDALRTLASAKGVTLAQLAIAWVMSRGDDIVALIGARQPSQVVDAVEGAGILLTDEEVASIEKALPHDAVAGTRYAAEQLAALDSERKGEPHVRP